MVAILLSAAVTCIASLFLGQAALRLAGAQEWSWLAPSIGISIVMMIAVTSDHVPGRTATVAAIVAALALAAIVWCALDRVHLPPLKGILAAVPVGILVLVPFLTAGRSGILGVSLDNDMGSHMLFVEIYLSKAVEHITPMRADYPLGPHAMVALISKGFGMRVDRAFAGWTMALPILSAWTALAFARRSSWPRQVLVATVVGMPFLVAAYYGEGSFKEVLQANLVLATVLYFGGYGPRLGRGKWVPVALLVGGVASVYSVTGFPWVAMVAGLWLLGLLVQSIACHETKGIPATIRGELHGIGIGVAVLVVVLLPQARRLHNFIHMDLGSGGIITPKSNLGNLAGQLPGWEGFGVWNNPDFRFPNPSHWGDVWIAVMVALALFGAFWAFRRGRWLLPLAAAGSMAIWAFSIHSQSPYVVAKGLVIASPLLVALAVFPFIDERVDRAPETLRTLARRIRGRPLSVGLAVLVALLVFFRVGIADVRALRVSPVGPTGHLEQLRELRPLMHAEPTLFLGSDDFIEWELAGVPVQGAVMEGGPAIDFRAEKPFTPSGTVDFDSVDAATLNEYDYVITSRDASGSAPPPQFQLIKVTPEYELWHRVGKVTERHVLAAESGGTPGAVLDCNTPEGHRIVTAGGVAAVRPEPTGIPAPAVAAGTSASAPVELPAGSYELDEAYVSPLPVAIEVGSMQTTLPANLEALGQRWPIGRITSDGEPLSIGFRVEKNALTPAGTTAILGPIIATPVGSHDRVVPVRRACGRYIDWYRSAKTP
jgi:hypothetical protein